MSTYTTNGGELLGQGTYGCVFYPALPCNQNKKRPNGVGKIMDLGYGADDEVEMMNKIALLDPQEKFTIHLTEKCDVNISDIEPTDDPTKKCKILMRSKNKIVEQLVYKTKGKDLSHYLDQKYFNMYTANGILKGFVNLANGLVELQKKKVCHRDIKPANVLLTDDGTLVFIDFGMSTEYDNVYTKENMSLLKYQYVYYPPEFKWIASMEETRNEIGLNNEKNENYYNRWKEFVKKTAIVTNKMFQEYQNKNLKLFDELYDDPQKEMDTQIDASIQKFIDSEVTNHKEDHLRYMYAFCNKIDVFSLGIVMLDALHHSRHEFEEEEEEIDNKFKEILKKAVHFNIYERYTPKQLYKELKNFYENIYLKRYPDGLSANNPILIEDDTPSKSASKSATKSVPISVYKTASKSETKSVSKSVPRERKTKSDISDSALIKLARKAGVVAVSGRVIFELKDVIEDRLEIILKKAATLIEYNKKKIFSEKILAQTFDQFNIKMFGAEYEDLKRCKTDKSKPKNVIKTIRFLQKQSDCVYISKSGFKRLVTSILGYFKDNIKVSEAASLMLQIYFENKTIDLIGNANLVAIHAGRKTLFPIDVRITIKLVKDPLDDFKYRI